MAQPEGESRVVAHTDTHTHTLAQVSLTHTNTPHNTAHIHTRVHLRTRLHTPSICHPDTYRSKHLQTYTHNLSHICTHTYAYPHSPGPYTHAHRHVHAIDALVFHVRVGLTIVLFKRVELQGDATRALGGKPELCRQCPSNRQSYSELSAVFGALGAPFW